MDHATPSQIPVLLPLAAVAKCLGLSIPTIHRAVNRGEIALAPISGRRRVATAELERIIGRKLTAADFTATTSHGPDTGHALASAESVPDDRSEPSQ